MYLFSLLFSSSFLFSSILNMSCCEIVTQTLVHHCGINGRKDNWRRWPNDDEWSTNLSYDHFRDSSMKSVHARRGRKERSVGQYEWLNRDVLCNVTWCVPVITELAVIFWDFFLLFKISDHRLLWANKEGQGDSNLLIGGSLTQAVLHYTRLGLYTLQLNSVFTTGARST